MSNLIDKLEKRNLKEDLPDIRVGDTVIVSKVIIEGQKQRVQKFEGVVIKVQGQDIRKSIIVRKIVDKIGVEKSFLLNSELVPEVKVLKKGLVRRSRLHYLRDRIGIKASRVKTRDTR